MLVFGEQLLRMKGRAFHAGFPLVRLAVVPRVWLKAVRLPCRRRSPMVRAGFAARPSTVNTHGTRLNITPKQ